MKVVLQESETLKVITERLLAEVCPDYPLPPLGPLPKELHEALVDVIETAFEVDHGVYDTRLSPFDKNVNLVRSDEKLMWILTLEWSELVIADPQGTIVLIYSETPADARTDF